MSALRYDCLFITINACSFKRYQISHIQFQFSGCVMRRNSSCFRRRNHYPSKTAVHQRSCWGDMNVLTRKVIPRGWCWSMHVPWIFNQLNNSLYTKARCTQSSVFLGKTSTLRMPTAISPGSESHELNQHGLAPGERVSLKHDYIPLPPPLRHDGEDELLPFAGLFVLQAHLPSMKLYPLLKKKMSYLLYNSVSGTQMLSGAI